MNKHLGIDYGTKKIGLALSDDRGMIAFPHSIIAHDAQTIETIIDLCTLELVSTLVIGKSVMLDGTHNPVMSDIQTFVEELKQHTNIPIHLEKEWMSSVSARAGMYTKGNIANPKWTGKHNQKKRGAIDDNAAAIILQRFLDKKPLT